MHAELFSERESQYYLDVQSEASEPGGLLAGDAIKFATVFRSADVGAGLSTSVVTSEEAQGESNRYSSSLSNWPPDWSN